MKLIRKLQVFFRKAEHLLLPALEYKTQLSVAVLTDLLKLQLLSNPKYAASGRLEPYGFSVYSQNDEDGIIQEIFKRIGTTSKTFVEFGFDALQNNTAYLLMQGWNGLWLDGSSKIVDTAKTIFQKAIDRKQLSVVQAFITKDNINSLISGGLYGGGVQWKLIC
ncbi:hypothetical protein AGMMS49965_11520 [Bacteroidia bacterium]|nr:hypothetical protein AGMMS49965_11520 [Bacteroidia bacterium]